MAHFHGAIAGVHLHGNGESQAAGGAAPVLSAPSASPTGSTTVLVGATTDTASGTLYVLARIGGSPALAAAIEAGGQSAAVSSTGPSFSYTGLTAATAYSFDFAQKVGTDYSNVVTASATTDNPGSGGGTLPEMHEGGSSAGVEVSASGAGTALEQASGGASAGVEVAASGAGTAAEQAAGGSSAGVQVSTAGAGTAAEAASGGSSALVEVSAAGAGSSQEDGAATGGSSARVEVSASGAGVAVEHASGGSSAGIAVSAAGAGVSSEPGGGGDPPPAWIFIESVVPPPIEIVTVWT